MEILNGIRRAIQACSDVIKWGAGIQEDTRKKLVEDLHAICFNCDEAYEAVLKRLVPVKNAFSDKSKLARELRTFAADAETRSKFKPEHLCGQVDQLLVRLASNLDPLKYSVDYRRINDVRDGLFRSRNVDAAIREAYDELTSQLDNIATEINSQAADGEERARYAQRIIQDFEAELRSALADLREAKAKTLGIA